MMRILAAMTLVLVGCSDKPGPVTPGPPDLANGAEIFRTVCAQCHGPAGEGVKDRGKNLPLSPFVNQSTDAEVVAMIRVGRPPTTERPAMPPKGGRLDLTTQDLFDVVAFVRSLPETPGPAQESSPIP